MKSNRIGKMAITLGMSALLYSPGGLAGIDEVVELMTLNNASFVNMLCPLVWEDLSVEIDVDSTIDDLWDSPEDKQMFRDLIEAWLTDEAGPPTAEVVDSIVSDIRAVAKACADQRIDAVQNLVKTTPNDLLIAMEAGFDNTAGSPLGSAADTPGQSCKNIKERYPEATDGPYWIDVTGGDTTDAMEAYCDMMTDGGGWTFVTYLTGANTNPKTHFEDPYGTYSVTREATSDDYSLGIMNELADTEIMFAVTTPDPQAAILAEGFVQFRYSVNDPLFNHGPIPCSPGDLFEYRLNHESTLEYLLAEGPSCAGSIQQFNPQALTDTIYGGRGLVWMRDGYKGVGASDGMGTKLTGWNHSAWIYVR